MWGSRKAASEGLLPGRAVVGPLAIMALTPLAAVLFVYCNVHLRGSLTALFTELLNDPVSIVQAAWRTPTWPAIKILLVWSGFQLALMRWMPGSEYLGPITPTGNVPRYRANGFQSFVATLVVYLLGAHYFHWFDPSEIYFYYDQMICAMCMFSFALCAGLYVKGLHAPSSSDSGSTGNPVMDFYWGTELYPRILGWDVKQFTNCRFGMMAWTILPLVFAHKHMELHGELGHAMAVNVILQLVYTAKVSEVEMHALKLHRFRNSMPQFFWWETGYLSSIDIMHDRAGYYICWGCLVWVPVE
jgi:7-dehydrocholesterol reductase